MTYQLDFVDSIVASPGVRLNLGDGTTFRVVRDGTEFPPPPLRRVVTASMLAHGARIPSSVYDLREITLDLLVDASSADATATALQNLHRELDRPEGNILRLRESTTNPIFFRTLRTSANSVQHRLGPADGTRKRILLTLPAEPFGVGLHEDLVVNATLDTNPANANGCFLDVTGVKGTVETPAIIKWPSAGISAGRETIFASRRGGTPSAAPFLFQAEALTQGTNTTTQANDANFSGAGNNYSRCTFGTATMQNRLSTVDVGTAGVDLRGRYRIILRLRKNTVTDNVNAQLRWGDAAALTVVDNEAVELDPDNAGALTAADLGDIQIPIGNDPVYDPSTKVELPVSDSFWFSLRAERASGTGTLDMDFLLMVAADDRLAIVQWNDDSSSASDHWILTEVDGAAVAYAEDSSNRIISSAPAVIVGGLPILSPNQANRIYILRDSRPGDTWALTTVANVTIGHQPRYLSIRPAST